VGSRKRIVLTSVVARAGREHLRPLAATGFEVIERFDLDGTRDAVGLSESLAGAWAAVAGSERYSAKTLERLPDLRLIVRCGVGYDAIDVSAATERGIAVATTPDANTSAVADFTIALMLACLRQIAELDRTVRAGEWRPSSIGGDLSGATVGIVGLGAIGQGVARRLSGFDCKLLTVEPFPDVTFCRALSLEVLPLEDVLPASDVLTVHTPLLPETRDLIGASELSLMRRSAIIVSTSRGGIISEDALADALEDGSLAGAALDVFELEPLPRDHRLLKLNNVVLTPHMAAFSHNAVRSTVEQVVAAIRDVAAGQLPRGCVNPEALRQTATDRS
jgi:D-3-phosphoglycerate dehydrogenase